jgi:hypothetical protein
MYAKEYGKDIDIFPLLDLNGDGVSELIIYQLISLYAFGCANGEYQIILDYDTAGVHGDTEIIAVEDMNLNGTPEIVIAYSVSSGGDVEVDILEWDGSEFVSLVLYDFGEEAILTNNQVRVLYWYDSNYWPSSLPRTNGWAKVEIKDIEQNGTKELILIDDGYADLFRSLDTGPWRGQQKVLTWDGLHFRYSAVELTPPEYRFQTVNDADRLFLLGDYEHALALYQDVIFSDQLDFYSLERFTHNIRVAVAEANDEPKPTMPAPDPNEYLSLSAYARYRILLHHLAQGWVQDAAIVNDTLQAEHPIGTAGHPYAEMAALLWAEYQNSADLSVACQPVIAYVETHPELLDPLGNASYYGFQIHEYVPRDTCPFE